MAAWLSLTCILTTFVSKMSRIKTKPIPSLTTGRSSSIFALNIKTLSGNYCLTSWLSLSPISIRSLPSAHQNESAWSLTPSMKAITALLVTLKRWPRAEITSMSLRSGGHRKCRRRRSFKALTFFASRIVSRKTNVQDLPTCGRSFAS